MIINTVFRHVRYYPLRRMTFFGGFSVGATPLPIPNREVKPHSADGTAFSGRVGRRRILSPVAAMQQGFFFVGFISIMISKKQIFPYRSAAADKPLTGNVWE
jgi:hypothetical protein